MQNETSNRIPWQPPGYHSQQQPFVTGMFQVPFTGSSLPKVPVNARLRATRRSVPATFVGWVLARMIQNPKRKRGLAKITPRSPGC
jgi:hypothetical protein